MPDEKPGPAPGQKQGGEGQQTPKTDRPQSDRESGTGGGRPDREQSNR